ncbi:polysaccharide pyruvyl transferase family protein [Rathayibacter sp. VKM Ac-2759]|uniref:polysaccharide pyruvyl transferase family protein n=1 Tax=Rathayibacter sp. VKM Ac-2759 TaxID=2609252 RepID=UPI001315CF05|nr:polysaccharide pyruvyl transferase family protein [Rathayibacter sp. VKM Ac-2759]QHC67101.1 polysaccharide pyruvyl transferase family protein [Rathayibacter sp. VKM Ac-2759]
MPKIEVVHWNPWRPVAESPWARCLPLRRRVNNFGDLLGPIIVSRILELEGIDPSAALRSRRMLAVGSILKLARDGDTVWGIGANGKSLQDRFDFEGLDVRAVRGPRTRAFLRDLGISAPEIYGDPGLLVGTLWTREELRAGAADRTVTIIPNLNDLRRMRSQGGAPTAADGLVEPTRPVREVIRAIAASDLVVGSSLHAIVIAESLGIPARLVASASEPDFKYRDYYEGSGRTTFTPAATAAEAVAIGGERPIRWDASALLAAFPRDLWRGTGGDRG